MNKKLESLNDQDLNTIIYVFNIERNTLLETIRQAQGLPDKNQNMQIIERLKGQLNAAERVLHKIEDQGRPN